jgi:hypothetical protein
MGLAERWLPGGVTCGIVPSLLSSGMGNSRPVPGIDGDGGPEERWDYERGRKENPAVKTARRAGLPGQPICWDGGFGGANMTRPGAVAAVVARAPHLRMLRMVIS